MLSDFGLLVSIAGLHCRGLQLIMLFADITFGLQAI